MRCKLLSDRICGEERGRLNAECFNLAQDFILTIMQNRYYPEYVKSVQYCKHLIEVFGQENGTVSITDILFDETALFYFIEVGLFVVMLSMLYNDV